jgi:hypothetical protein
VIHPIEVGRAFGGDRDHPAVPGRIVGNDGDRAMVALSDGSWISVGVEDLRCLLALQRADVTRYGGRELVVLVNARYGLVGLAIGPPIAPRQLALCHAVARVENGSVVEIPGEGSQPGWLIFRCQIEPVFSLGPAAAGTH